MGLRIVEMLPEFETSSTVRNAPKWLEAWKSEKASGCKKSRAAAKKPILANACKGSAGSKLVRSKAGRHSSKRAKALAESSGPGPPKLHTSRDVSRQTEPAAVKHSPKQANCLARGATPERAASETIEAEPGRAQLVVDKVLPGHPGLRR